MTTPVELVLDTGDRERVGSIAIADSDTVLLACRAALQAARSRPDVVAAVARHEGGGEVRVDRVRAPEKTETVA